MRTADHSHQYTTGIIPPRIPSTPTTDTSDELIERKPFERRHKNHYSPDPFHTDSQDNIDDDTEDSDSMSQVQPHNRDRVVQQRTGMKAGRDFGTQVDERPTRTIGTMSEPVKTRNAGNEVQPQSSSTQTFDLLREQQQHKEDIMDYRPSASYRERDDRRTNGHYPSYRSTSLDHRDHHDNDHHRSRHRSHYRDDPHDPYISARDRYHPHSSSSRRHHRHLSPSSPHGTPPPPAPYRSTSPDNRHRSPSPSSRYHFSPSQRHRSRSPSPKKYSSTSALRQNQVSPPSQRRSRSPQRSPSPTFSKRPIPSQVHHTPSPPFEYCSIIPNDREEPRPKADSRSRKTRPKMVSAGTDTNLDGIRPSSRRDHRSQSPPTRRYDRSTSIEKVNPSQSNDFHRRTPTSDYQKLDNNPLRYTDYTKQDVIEGDHRATRDYEPTSTRKNYRLRPDPNDSFPNNYEENPSKHNESSSSPLIHSLSRPKEYTPKIYTDDRRRSVSPSRSHRSDRNDQHPDEFLHERYLRELPKGGSVSIPSTTVLQPETTPRSHKQKKPSAPSIQNHFDRSKPVPQLHRAHERQTSADRNSLLLNFATSHIDHQPFPEEVAIPFDIRYTQEPERRFSDHNLPFRSSTSKRDDLRTRSNQIVLLPVLNSSRTHILEKQSFRGSNLRQSRSNGNFYLAPSPTVHQFNSSSNIDDSDQFNHSTTFQSQVA